jgi:hypothetical protein
MRVPGVTVITFVWTRNPNTKRTARVEKLLGESGMCYFRSIEFVLTAKHFRRPYCCAMSEDWKRHNERDESIREIIVGMVWSHGALL